MCSLEKSWLHPTLWTEIWAEGGKGGRGFHLPPLINFLTQNTLLLDFAETVSAGHRLKNYILFQQCDIT